MMEWQPTEMELRVALGICKSRALLGDEPCTNAGRACHPEDGGRTTCIVMARAAIRAMREPTTSQIDAALYHDSQWSINAIPRIMTAWRSMIDSASPPDPAPQG